MSGPQKSRDHIDRFVPLRGRLLVATGFALLGLFIRRVVDFGFPTAWEYWLVPLTIPLALLYWEIFARIHHRLNHWLSLERQLTLRITVQLALGAAVFLVSRQIGLLFFRDFLPKELNLMHYILLVIADICASVAINLSFISIYFFRRWKRSIIRAERHAREKAQIRYEQLRQLVDPHFLFNTLSSLDSLIRSDPELASRFVMHLSRIYRYILQNKEREIVDLETELRFFEEYRALQNIRYGPAIDIDVKLPGSVPDRGIVMLTLQMLVDNAVKHNEVHEAHPLRVEIVITEDHLTVSNGKRPRGLLGFSSGQGLAQLRSLYALHSERPMEILDTGQHFSVQIPLL